MKDFWQKWDVWTDEVEKEFMDKTGAAPDSFWVQDDGSVVIKAFRVIPAVFPPKTVTSWETWLAQEREIAALDDGIETFVRR